MEQAAESEHMDNLLQLKGGKLFRAFVILFCFFGFGIGFYSFWEEMQPYEALYFTILTISTVGYGDVTPETDHGKLFTCVFVFAGLALLAEAMSIIADYLIERMNRMSRKVAEEAAARQKEEAARRANEEKIKSAESNLKVLMQGGGGRARSPTRDSSRATKRGAGFVKFMSRGSDGDKDEDGENSTTRPPGAASRSSAMQTLVTGMVAVQNIRRKGGTLVKSMRRVGAVSAGEEEKKSEGDSMLNRNFSNMSQKEIEKQMQEEEEKHEAEEEHQRIVKLAVNTFYIALSVLTGTIFFSVAENKSIVDALYMSCITVTSVGYGDVKPDTVGGKIFAMFWILIGTFLVAKAIGGYLDFATNHKQQEIRKRILTKPLTLKEVEMADIDDSKSLSEAEFVLYKLQAMGILNRKDVEKVNRKFRLELNPGEDGEVRIPTAKHVDQCLRDGKDFNFAMRSYQDTAAAEMREEKEEKIKEHASSNLAKRKLGKYAGALHKVKQAIKESENAKMIEFLESDFLLTSLPPVENSDVELDKEIKDIHFIEAKAKLKKLESEQTGKAVDEAGGIARTQSSVQNAAATLIANLKGRQTKLGQSLARESSSSSKASIKE